MCNLLQCGCCCLHNLSDVVCLQAATCLLIAAVIQFSSLFSTTHTFLRQYSYKLTAKCALPLLLYCLCAINLFAIWLNACQRERIVAAISEVMMVECHSWVWLSDFFLQKQQLLQQWT